MNTENNGLVIESGIPIPVAKKPGMLAILRRMKIGDSVVVDKNGARNFWFAARGNNMKVATRTVTETHSRVWRIG